MKHPVIALLLACITVAFVFSLLTLMPRPDQGKTKVKIESPGDVSDIVTAIESLKRTDVDITTSTAAFEWGFTIRTAFIVALAMLINFGIILFFYKLYCRWFGITPLL
ncbi:MAG: hypothetical protein LV480_03390 [Methylacidiphilales bacterium]|nr:hypothetical protein [Candidatus Methylacidiphilales bacterium]